MLHLGAMLRKSGMITVAIMAWTCFATSGQAEPVVSFGPFPIDITAAEAVSAHPELGWKVFRSRDSGVIVGAEAETPVSFAGLDWIATVGDTYGFFVVPNTYSLDLNADVEKSDAEACFQAMSDIVAGLEAQFGAFGQHPAFIHDDNAGTSLYGGLGEFNVRTAGNLSIVRDYGEGQYTTFVETDEDTGKAVMVGAIYLDYFKSCGLRVHAFQSEERIERARISRKKFE